MEFFSDSTGLYLFSALLQANGAIIAIIGVFGIFRIQNLYQRIDYIKQIITQPVRHISYRGMSPFDVDKFEDMTVNSKEKECKNHINSKRLLESWILTEKKILVLKPIIINSTVWLSLGVIVNALCLIFSNPIHKIQYVECIVFGVIFVYQIILMIIIFVNIRRIL